MRNSGTCQRDILPQYYGLGSETRRTDTDVPDPFGIVVGNPAEIPQGVCGEVDDQGPCH